MQRFFPYFIPAKLGNMRPASINFTQRGGPKATFDGVTLEKKNTEYVKQNDRYSAWIETRKNEKQNRWRSANSSEAKPNRNKDFSTKIQTEEPWWSPPLNYHPYRIFFDWKSLFYSILRIFRLLQTRFLFLDGVGDGQKFEYMVQKWFDSSTLWGGVTVPCYLYLVCRFFCTIFGESAKAWGEKADTTFQAFVDWKLIRLSLWEDPEKWEIGKGT